MRPCKKCGATERYASGDCKPCARRIRAEYVKNNKEKVKESNNKSRKLHPESYRESSKRYRAKNPELQRLQVRASMAKKPDYYKLSRRKWVVENRQRKNAIDAKYKKAHPELKRVYNSKRRCIDGKLSKDIVKKLLLIQKGKCACCGNDLGNNYHLDHIMPIALGGTNNDSNMQLLKASCNLQKGAMHPIDFMNKRGLLC